MQRIKWTEPIEVEMPDGVVYQLRPGYRHKGVSVTPAQTGHTTSTGGRPPQGSTLKLRQKIEQDRSRSQVRPAQEYLDWIVKAEPGLERDTARQAVYRELRRHGATRGTPGRPPTPQTLELRKKLERDAAKGKLREPKQYVAWILKRHPDMAKPATQQVVHREMQRLRSGGGEA